MKYSKTGAQPKKWLGHGLCESKSSSITMIPCFLSPKKMASECMSLYKKMNIAILHIRAVGIHVKGLQKATASTKKQTLLHWKPKPKNPKTTLHWNEVDPTVFKELPLEIQLELKSSLKPVVCQRNANVFPTPKPILTEKYVDLVLPLRASQDYYQEKVKLWIESTVKPTEQDMIRFETWLCRLFCLNCVRATQLLVWMKSILLIESSKEWHQCHLCLVAKIQAISCKKYGAPIQCLQN